ncbi:MAG: hypothetical protein PV340_01460 [Wolbachia sp.]|nr:hypothetical protein [Wolbachia sp.]
MPSKSSDRALHVNFLVQHPDFSEFTTQMFFTNNCCDNCIDLILEDFLVVD